MANIETLAADTRYFAEVAAPATPSAGQAVVYVKTDGKIYLKDDAGTETDLTASGTTFAGVRAYAGAATSLTNNTWVSLALNSERFDTDAFHDTATNNSRLTVPSGKGGKYLIGGVGEVVANVTGVRACRIYLNGTTRIAETIANAINSVSYPSARIHITTLYDLSVGDYVELQMFQDSGGAINSANTANSTSEFWMYKVG